MRANSPGSFAWSTTLHAGVAALVLVATFWWHRAKEIPNLDFDLVALDQLELGEKTEMPGPPDPSPSITFNQPNVKPMPIPKPPKVEPVKETKKPEPAKPDVKKAQPEKKPTKKTQSYADWQKQNQKQLQANQKVRAASRNVKAPTIDAKGIVGDLSKAAKGTGASKATIAALDAYWARLRAALKAAWEKPDSLNDLLSAKVEFYLASDGSLSRVRIARSSGDADFDESVLDAFRRVRSLGAVPGGTSGTFEIAFKMSE